MLLELIVQLFTCFKTNKKVSGIETIFLLCRKLEFFKNVVD